MGKTGAISKTQRRTVCAQCWIYAQHDKRGTEQVLYVFHRPKWNGSGNCTKALVSQGEMRNEKNYLYCLWNYFTFIGNWFANNFVGHPRIYSWRSAVRCCISFCWISVPVLLVRYGNWSLINSARLTPGFI